MDSRRVVENEYTIRELQDVWDWFHGQGRGDYEEEIKYHIVVSIGKGKIMKAVEQNIDLVDLERWVILEKISGMDIPWENASALEQCLWNNEIDVLDLL